MARGELLSFFCLALHLVLLIPLHPSINCAHNRRKEDYKQRYTGNDTHTKHSGSEYLSGDSHNSCGNIFGEIDDGGIGVGPQLLRLR